MVVWCYLVDDTVLGTKMLAEKHTSTKPKGEDREDKGEEERHFLNSTFLQLSLFQVLS